MLAKLILVTEYLRIKYSLLIVEMVIDLCCEWLVIKPDDHFPFIRASNNSYFSNCCRFQILSWFIEYNLEKDSSSQTYFHWSVISRLEIVGGGQRVGFSSHKFLICSLFKLTFCHILKRFFNISMIISNNIKFIFEVWIFSLINNFD